MKIPSFTHIHFPKISIFFSKQKTWVFIFIFFLLMFPKGGFKINKIPITWGYILVGIFSLYWVIKRTKKIHKNHLYAYILTLPFQITAIISTMSFGFLRSWTLTALIINAIVLPFIIFIIFSDYINSLDIDHFHKVLKKGIIFIAIYGIFLFFYKLFTGSFFEIPFLTVNYSDFGNMEETKNINRGFLFKLISTYNNGNIYGVCLLMLLPLYQHLEKRNIYIFFVILSLILTLSRTVWAGLILVELFYFFIYIKNKKISLSIISLYLMFFSFVCLIFIKYFHLISRMFLINNITNLGGRAKTISSMTFTQIFAKGPFNSVSEMTYTSIMHNFGLIGIIFFIISISSALIIYSIRKNKIKNEHSTYIGLGLLSYMICAIIDGAYSYIPTMFFFWFLSSLLLKNSSLKLQSKISN